MRGRIAIHAGLAEPCAKGVTLRFAPDSWVSHFVHDGLRLQHQGSDLVRLPLGAVVATAELVDCVRTEDTGTPTLERRLGDWTPGRWAWELADVRPLEEPLPARGKQGWWDWTPPEGVA